jgi:predicted metalloprotease with PDZ domain
MKKYLFFVLITFFANFLLQAQEITYKLSAPEPHTHYFEVEMHVKDFKKDQVDFRLPTWTPGSYLIREYARHVEGVSVQDGKGKALNFEKTNKNTWKVDSKKANEIVIKYRVYAFELTVRTSFVDISHGYLNGASIFMYVEGLQDNKATLEITPFKEWKVISTSLKPVANDPWTLQIPNYTILVDSPIEMGNHKVYTFKASGVLHKVAVYGEANYDEKTFTKDLAKIVESTTAIVGEHPGGDYTFIVHNVARGGGGLEHLNSTSLIFNRFAYGSEHGYRAWLGLVAHEYFHLWNVKRVRPEALGPFNYNEENYTHSLWVAEGFTAYYDDLLLVRSGFMTPDQYLGYAMGNIRGHEGKTGKDVQSVADASFDAWIKFYRSNENSSNTTVSYYGTGAVYATLLDLEIIHSTKGEKSLDDLMKYLYKEFYQKKQKGYSDAELQAAAELIAGKKLDGFFNDYIFGTKTIDYNKYYGYAGIEVVKAANEDLKLGVSTKDNGGKLVISRVNRATPAYNDGLNVNDEILAINGYRIASSKDLTSAIDRTKKGDKLKFTVVRDGRLENLEVTMQPTEGKFDFSFKVSDKKTKEQKVVYDKWLATKR